MVNAVLRAGAARVEITPDLPTPMAGYPMIKRLPGGPPDHLGYVGRTGPSAGCHDPLYSRALALGDETHTIVLVALDLCIVTDEFTRQVRERVAEEVDVNFSAITLAASHTHNGPDLFSYWEPAPHGSADMARERTVQAIVSAVRAMRPAAIGWGRGSLSEPLANRRDPSRPTDPEIGILRVEDLTSRVIAIVFNYACHPIIPGPANRTFTADFPGYAARLVEHAHDPNAVCLFLNGAAGNINPTAFPYGPDRDVSSLARAYERAGKPVTFRSHTAARRLGTLLGGEVVRATELVRVSPSGTVDAQVRSVAVPLKAQDELQRYFEHLALSERARQAYGGQTEMDLEVQVLTICGGVFVCLPGEPFVEIGLRIKAAALGRPIFPVGYSNAYAGYVLTESDYDENRYESVATPLGRDAAERLQSLAIDMVTHFLE